MRLHGDTNTLHIFTLHVLTVQDIRLVPSFCTTDAPVTACIMLFLSSCNDIHHDTSITSFFSIYTASPALIQAFVRHCFKCSV